MGEQDADGSVSAMSKNMLLLKFERPELETSTPSNSLPGYRCGPPCVNTVHVCVSKRGGMSADCSPEKAKHGRRIGGMARQEDTLQNASTDPYLPR